MESHRRSTIGWGTAGWLALMILGRSSALAAPGPEEYSFHREGILGTSFDLTVRTANPQAANRVETAVLGEIERLRQILSSYDPASELARLNASLQPRSCSGELIEVLGRYDEWTLRTGGAYSGQLGELIELWREAERLDAPPGAAKLDPVVSRLRQPAWTIDECARTVRRLDSRRLNVDSLGKGFIIGRAAEAWKAVPGVAGLMLNIGGDIATRVAGGTRQSWQIAVANPAQPQDNAPALTKLRLQDRAVATSGSYERGYTISGRRYSHILDPRTGWPAEGVTSATVVAADNATANALATTLCVLPPPAGLALVESIPEADCLLVSPDGQQLRSTGFASYEVAAAPAEETAPPPPQGWPEDRQLSIALTLKTPREDRKVKRPYVAIWAENEKGERVRTIVMWGRKLKYFGDLPAWWQEARRDEEWAVRVSRATRPPGRHVIVWNGLDDHDQLVPPGAYKIVVEVNREHGSYAKSSGQVDCGKGPATAVLKATSEFEEVQLSVGPKTSPP